MQFAKKKFFKNIRTINDKRPRCNIEKEDNS